MTRFCLAAAAASSTSGAESDGKTHAVLVPSVLGRELK